MLAPLEPPRNLPHSEEFQETELPLESVGKRLSRARDAAGMSLEDVSARTKIATRHLIAIEEDRFSDLAGRTYAVGFARTYARSVGLDDAEIAEGVRAQLASEEAEPWPGPQPETFEPGDPARVPPGRLAWIAGLGALVAIVFVYILWRSFLAPAGELPDLIEDEQPEVVADAAPARNKASKLADPGGQVVFTALEPDIWVKFYDGAGEQLFQKQMAKGEKYAVPGDSKGPQLWTGRPDALRITIGGREVPMLGTEPVRVKDVPVSAAALLARGKEESAAGSDGEALQGAGQAD